MEAKVDVLKVMDDAARVASLCNPLVRQAQHPMSNSLEAQAYNLLGALPEARTTAADLITAGERVTAAFRANGSRSNGGFDPRTHQECEAAIVSLDRVLSRIGGAQ